MRHLFLPILVGACAPPLAGCGETPPPAAPVPAPAPPPPLDTAAPAPSAAPPPVDSNPTALTEEQRAKDRALAPQAAAIVDAYGNVASLFSSLVAQGSKDNKRVLSASGRDR